MTERRRAVHRALVPTVVHTGHSTQHCVLIIQEYKMATASSSANTECTESSADTETEQSSGDLSQTGDTAGRPWEQEGDTQERERMADDPSPDGSPHLTTEEEAATKKFLENVNKWRSARQLEEVRVVTLMNLIVTARLSGWVHPQVVFI